MYKLYFQKRAIRAGLLIKAPKLITGAVCEVPIRKLRMGICIIAPPPPLMVDRVNVAAPRTNKPMSSQIDISVKNSIKNPARGGIKITR